MITEQKMIYDTERRFKEGWSFKEGSGPYQTYEPYRQYDEIRFFNKGPTPFKTNQEATDYVARRAKEGSEYHQRAIEYVTKCQLLHQK